MLWSGCMRLTEPGTFGNASDGNVLGNFQLACMVTSYVAMARSLKSTFEDGVGVPMCCEASVMVNMLRTIGSSRC